MTEVRIIGKEDVGPALVGSLVLVVGFDWHNFGGLEDNSVDEDYEGEWGEEDLDFRGWNAVPYVVASVSEVVPQEPSNPRRAVRCDWSHVFEVSLKSALDYQDMDVLVNEAGRFLDGDGSEVRLVLLQEKTAEILPLVPMTSSSNASGERVIHKVWHPAWSRERGRLDVPETVSLWGVDWKVEDRKPVG